MKALKNILFLLGNTKKYLVWVVIFMAFMELGRVGGNEFFVRLVNGVVDSAGINWFFFAGWVAISLANWLSDAGVDFYTVKMLVEVEYSVPVRALKHLLTLSMNFFANAGTGKLAKKIENGEDGLGRLVESFCWEVISSIIQFSITATYLALSLWQWGVLLLIAAVVFLALTLLLDRLKKELRKKRYDLYEDSGHLLFQIMQNVPIVKAFAKEEAELKRFDTLRNNIREISLKEFRYEVLFNILRGSLITFALGGVFYLGVQAVQAGEIKVGSIVGAMNLAIASLHSLFRLTRIMVRFMDNYEAIDRVVGFLQEKASVVDREGALEVEKLGGDVEFENVYFAYNNGKDKKPEHCLKGVSFKISAGETVAVVGPSGSGKSTLISLLLRFMDPTKGVVKVGGYNISKLKQASYRKHLSVVMQESLLFDRTLGQNAVVGLSVDDYPEVEAAVWESLEQAHAVEFVKDFPGEKPLDTMIGEKGVKLSGGQKQRLAIAAALIRKPTILILDEATSSLDTKSEKEIQKALKKIQEKGDTTVFNIAHRLSTIKEADTIIVLDKGRIAQIGSHKELIANKTGLYAQMVGVQNL